MPPVSLYHNIMHELPFQRRYPFVTNTVIAVEPSFDTFLSWLF